MSSEFLREAAPWALGILSVLAGLTLLTLVPRLWQGTRAIAAMGATTTADRRWRALACGIAVTALILSGCAAVLDPGAGSPRHLGTEWFWLLEIVIAVVLVMSVLIVRSLARPAGCHNGHPGHHLAAARALVDRHGEDSISPFILRPDKSFAFAAGGVLAYRLVGETAVVSGDPVAPPGCAPAVLEHFLQLARVQNWDVVMYGASDRHLSGYRDLGLRTLCIGEEAVAQPDRFTLEGRPVRKLRQSVHRVERRGWQITAYDGRDIDAGLEHEIDQLEARWRGTKQRMIGFAMDMGPGQTAIQPDDLYLLARSPSGELGAVMHFISHCDKLSLDTMRRVGETPNGLNEALVCRALELAREREISEVSLNYAGLAHLFRHEPSGGRLRRRATTAALGLLGGHFQMERLVRFNEKFSPDWRPRYLVYQSRGSLPRAVVRVLQAEGYLPERRRERLARRARIWSPLPPRLQQPRPSPDGS